MTKEKSPKSETEKSKPKSGDDLSKKIRSIMDQIKKQAKIEQSQTTPKKRTYNVES